MRPPCRRHRIGQRPIESFTHHLSIKTSSRDNHEIEHKGSSRGEIYQIKGKVKEMAGKISGNPDLEVEGSAEKVAGKVQEKIGDIEKVFGK